MTRLSCFKAYDIRGQLVSELDEDIAYRIGRAFAQEMSPQRVVIGGDARETSEALKAAVAKGLVDAGVDVIDIGMTGTEEVYFAAKHLDVQGGIEVTASHNPIDYNGMKLVREDAKPISGDSGLNAIQALAEAYDFPAPAAQPGQLTKQSLIGEYIQHLLGYIDLSNLVPMTLVMNAGNGAAGHVVDALEEALSAAGAPITMVKIHNNPDPSFPNGIPNPMLVENRAATRDAVLEHKADLGIAWDGDFDRCFLFDRQGEFIEGYYIVGLLAEAFLRKHPGETVIHDPRLTWNTINIADECDGKAVQSKTGHAFIKERMRAEDAIYGGEMSAHHYFRDFAYCDSGMIPWLLIIELIGRTGQPLHELVAERMAQFPSSGEINRKVSDAKALLAEIEARYAPTADAVQHVDGLSVDYAQWRFNLRMSNTEPVVRLNVESRGDEALMQAKTQELLAIIDTFV